MFLANPALKDNINFEDDKDDDEIEGALK